MNRTNRLYCILAALFLAFSAAALAGHSVIHAGGAEQCMMCASHAEMQGAGPTVHGPPPSDPGMRTVPWMQFAVRLFGRSEFSPPPRAPPSHS